MKLITAIFTLLTFASFAQTNDFGAIDKKNGFRNYKFGTPIDSFKNFVLTEESKGGTKYYKKTVDNLKIGDYQLESISYGFYKGKFYYVHIQTRGLVNSRGVLAVLTEQYGEGFKANEYIEEYAWLGKIATCLYDENAVTKDAEIVFLNNEIQGNEDNDKKISNQKAKSDL